MIAIACAGAYSLLQGLKGLGVCLALRQDARGARPALPAGWMQQVGILQPILGGDPLLAEVLADNLAALPEAQFFWLLDENDALGRATAQALVAAHPHCYIRCSLHAAAPAGTNPKTFKLAAVLPDISTGVCLVLDDDARLSAAALARMVGDLERADLVTALPCYRDDGAPGARLMAQFVNNNAALTYLALLALMPPLSINGMCYALRTARLRSLGGFAPLLCQLADDLAMARALRAQGASLYQSTACVEVQTHTPSLARYAAQMHRWFLFATLLLRSERPALQGLIGLLHGLPALLLWGLLVAAVAAPGGLGLVLWVLLARSALLCGLQWRLTGRIRHRPLVSVLAELLQPLHLLHAMRVRRIRWRTRLYAVRANGDFDAV